MVGTGSYVPGVLGPASTRCAPGAFSFCRRPRMMPKQPAPRCLPAMRRQVRAGGVGKRRVRSVGDTDPPFRPALAARLLSCENDRFSGATDFPPLLAISRRRSGLIDANPRFPFAFFIVPPPEQIEFIF